MNAIREKDAEKLFTNLEANMTIGLKYLHSRLGNKETGHTLSDTETRAALRMDRT